VEETWWTIEVGIPLEQMGVQVISPGTTWGFNLARIRHGGADMGEYGEWAPTYGRAHSSDHFGFLLFD
jgi:hypothetical protein